MQKAAATKVKTVAGTTVAVRDFESWNERMFTSYGNDRLYYHGNPVIRKVQARRISTILRFLDIHPDDHVLDAGCGEGYLFSQCPGSARQVGVDISATALQIASARNTGVDWVRSDVHDMPFPSASFDKICCSEVIEHLLDPVSLLRELYRVCKPTGRVVITVPNEKTINKLKDLVFSMAWGSRLFSDIPRRTEWHLTEYTPELLLSQLKPFFTIERAKVLPVRCLPLGYGVSCRPR